MVRLVAAKCDVTSTDDVSDYVIAMTHILPSLTSILSIDSNGISLWDTGSWVPGSSGVQQPFCSGSGFFEKSLLTVVFKSSIEETSSKVEFESLLFTSSIATRIASVFEFV